MKRTLILPLIMIILMSLIALAGAGFASETHRVDILNVFMSDASLTCNKELSIAIEYRNRGTEDEFVHFELVNSKLGIDEFIPIVMVPPTGLGSVTIPLTLAEEPAAGEYELEVLAYFNNEIRRSFASFVFKGCPEAPASPVQPDATLLAQSGSESKTILEQGWSTQTWFMLVMVIVIFLLVIIYLLKLWIENIGNRT